MDNKGSSRGRRIWRAFARYGSWILFAVVGGVVAFELLQISVFTPFGSPHLVCYLANPKLIWLHVITDAMIGIAYVSISLTLGFLVYKASKDIPFHLVFLAFGLFIVSCGFTHFMEVLVIWQPLYWLSGYVKVITAAASVATAVALFPLVPKIFATVDSVKKAEARRKQVEILNQDLEAFTSSVAHDLRAPLRAIAGLSLALKEDYSAALDDTGRDYVKRVVDSAQRMDRLIIDLLNYSRIGSERVNLGNTDLDVLVDDAQSTLAREIREADATLQIERPLGTVTTSNTLLVQVLTNLIGNGIKFVVPGRKPVIRIHSERRGGRIRVYVTDNGIGIPPEHQSRIFKMFERLNPDYPGTGIGLAIVQRAVQRMNGELGLSSEVGVGTTFWVELPQGDGTASALPSLNP